MAHSISSLHSTIQAKGYNRCNRQAASHYLNINLIVEGHHQYNIPFIVLNLGAHEVILGHMWFEYFWVNLDVAGHKLIWPLKNTPTPSFMQIIQIAHKDLVHQTTPKAICKDIAQRDATIAHDDKRQQDGRCILK